MNYGSWQAVPGCAQQVRERFSCETVEIWIWNGGPIKLQAWLVEREKVLKWDPKIYHREPKGERTDASWQFPVPRERYLIASVPTPWTPGCDTLDMHSNYHGESRDLESIFALSEKGLARRAMALLNPTAKRLKQELDSVNRKLSICKELVK